MAAQVQIWINTFDLKDEVTKWSTAVTDEELLPSLRLAQIDLKTMLPAALYTAVNTAVTANYAQWTRTKTYALNDRVLWDNRLYKALGATTNHEPPNATYWTELEIWTVWRDYFKPFLCWKTAANYIPHANKWVAQEGLRSIVTGQNIPLNNEDTASMANHYQNVADKYYLAFTEYMNDNNDTIDTVEYTGSGEDLRTFKTSPKIRIV